MSFSPKQRSALLKIVAVLLILGVAGVLLMRGVNLRALFDQVMSYVRSVGPVVFFLAMALLPGIGFPMLAFTLSAGPAFGAELGLPTVAGLVIVSFMANVAWTYWLSRYAMRPFFTKLLERLGYKVPKLDAGDHLGMALVVRLTPGPPFFAQSYLMGLIEIHFWTYFAVSFCTTGILSVAVVIFGDTLVHGSAGHIVFALSFLIALMVVIRMVRKRVTAKRAKAS